MLKLDYYIKETQQLVEPVSVADSSVVDPGVISGAAVAATPKPEPTQVSCFSATT